MLNFISSRQKKGRNNRPTSIKMVTKFLLPWVPEVFSLLRRGGSSAAGRLIFGLRLKTRRIEWWRHFTYATRILQGFKQGNFFKTWPKPDWHPGYVPDLNILERSFMLISWSWNKLAQLCNWPFVRNFLCHKRADMFLSIAGKGTSWNNNSGK